MSYNGGRGVGRHDGLVVFVPWTVPGDLIRARVVTEKPKYWEAALIEVLEPGPARRKPPCEVVGRCGGCTWQQVAYPEQLVQKEKILRKALQSIERLQPIEWRPFIPSPEEFHYRNRIQLHVRGGQLGFFARESNDLVEIQSCHLAAPELNLALSDLKQSLASAPKVKRIELAVSTSGQVVSSAGQLDPEVALFSQVNTAQNQLLQKAVIEAGMNDGDWILDLFAGSGNFTVPLARAHPEARITAIELSRASVARGEKLVEQLGLDHVYWIAGDVGQQLQRLAPEAGIGMALVDPPRTGLTKLAVTELLRHRPKQILYVSCNPMTFARDAQSLISGGQFRLLHVQGFDMFPQTEHIELLACFTS